MRPIAFDIGNVLVNIDFAPFEKCWNQYELHHHENYMDFLLDLHGQQDVGLTTIRRAVKERFGKVLLNPLNPKLDEIDLAWNKIIAPNKPMIHFMNNLKAEGHPIALWSNMGKEHAELLKNEYPEIMEGKIHHLSCEVGARKPTKLYYQSFLMDYPEFKNCIYLDDLIQNVDRAKSYGIKAIHFDLKKEIKNNTLLKSLQNIRDLLTYQ